MKDKGNDGKGNNPERDLWETEQSFWDKLHKQYSFDFDCCASKKNRKVTNYSDDFEKRDSIYGTAWMNPPFSNARRMFEHFFKIVKRGVAIYRFDNPETKIWQEVIFPNATWVFIPKGRISYTPFDIDMRNGLGTRFPSALIGINVEPPKTLGGITLTPSQSEGNIIIAKSNKILSDFTSDSTSRTFANAKGT